jgi:uncharacterized membrane protein YhfC
MTGRDARRAVLAATTAAVASLASAGCVAPTEPLPHDERRGTPGDGELFVYDVVATADGTRVGRSAARWTKRDRGLEVARGAADLLVRDVPPENAVIVDPKTFEVIATWKGTGDARVEATWDHARNVVVMKGPSLDLTVPVPAGTRDNDEMLEVMRFSGLEPGASRRAAVFNAGMRGWMPVQLDVLGAIDVVTPAGTFRAVDHRTGFGTKYHHVFIEEAPPHRLVRYDNPGTGMSFVLRSHRTSKTDTTPIETAPVEVPKAVVRPSIVATTLLVQWPLMIALPIWLAFRQRKAFGLPWSIWGLGMLGFVLSQVVHLPLNWAIGLMGAPRGVGLASPPVVAAAAGLSAGLCEEVVRWLVLRRFATRGHVGARVGVFAGTGHGGVEASIFGLLAAANAVSMWALSVLPPESLGVPPEQRDAVAKQLVVYWAMGWESPIYAGVERLSAIVFHIGMSVLIARGIERGRALAYVALAVLAHATYDAVLVYAAPRLGILAIEAMALAVAIPIAILVGRALRRPTT